MSLDQDYKAIRVCINRSHGATYEKERILRKLRNQYREAKRIEGLGYTPPPLMAKADGSWRKALCCARMISGDYSKWDGWEFRSDYASTCWHEGMDRLGLPMWNAGHTGRLLVLAEEGIGDEVLFMSLLPECIVRVPSITVECDPRLQSVIERRFRVQTVPRLGTLSKIQEWVLNQNLSAQTASQETATMKAGVTSWILMGDLARYFRRDLAHFPRKPYLKADPERVREMEKFRGRIGISWAGNHGRLPPNLLALEDSFILPLNLQYNETSPFAAEPGIDLKNDIEGLFALCSVLSKVVTVSTSIAHIAGSVGCPVDVIHAPHDSEGKNALDILNWKWPEGKTPWYGSARVFRNLKQYEMTG